MAAQAMTTAVDLSDVLVVDNHCHSVYRDQQHLLPQAFRPFFTESPDPATRTDAVPHTVFYQRLITASAALHGVEPTEEAVLTARASFSATELTAFLFSHAGIGALVVDTGFPDAAGALELGELGAAAVPLLRLELLFQDLVAAHTSLADLRGAVEAQLRRARADGWFGFKSVAGYRTGLDIERWDEADVVRSHAAARRETEAAGSVRLGHKPLLDTLLHLAFEAAAAQELPVQFHVGYGDPDADLRAANPLMLRNVLEERAYRAMPVVMLHGCWPFVREAAYLAAVYGNAYLDLSYAPPFVSRAEMRAMTAAALGAAPTSRLMYSSDGSQVPELHWHGAIEGRRALASALGELVDDGDLTAAQAQEVGANILRHNAISLYGLADREASRP